MVMAHIPRYQKIRTLLVCHGDQAAAGSSHDCNPADDLLFGSCDPQLIGF